MSAEPPGSVTGNMGPITVNNLTSGAFSLLAVDFQGVYQVHVAAATERLAMLRFSLSLLAAPFGATVALVSAKVLPPAALTAWPHLPRYLFGLLAASGLLAVLPYLRMVEASVTHARTARAMNNFRLLYTLQLRPEFIAAGWSPNLPVDPRFPAVFAPFGWPGISAFALAALDAAWITVGVAGVTAIWPPPALLAAAAAVLAGCLFSASCLREGGRRHRPANPFGFPSVET